MDFIHAKHGRCWPTWPLIMTIPTRARFWAGCSGPSMPRMFREPTCAARSPICAPSSTIGSEADHICQSAGRASSSISSPHAGWTWRNCREGLTTGRFNDNRSHVHAATVEAVDLYRGRFLEGFYLRGCTAFEEWQLLTAETIQRQVVEALSTLAEQQEVDGDYRATLRFAWRCAELEPLSDEANRRVIRLLAVRGDSDAALGHYQRFAELLVDELEMMPTTETQRLADQIAAGRIAHRTNLGEAPDTALPPFLPDAVQTSTPKPFVAAHGRVGCAAQAP